MGLRHRLLPPILLLLPILSFVVAAARAQAQSISLRSGAREETVDLATLPEATLDLRDPTDGNKPKRLIGPLLSTFLARLPPPPGADTLAVRCDDGWLSLVPLDAVTRVPGAVLARFIESSASGLSAKARLPVPAPRGPVYLAFPTTPKRSTALEKVLSENGYAFATRSIEYVKRDELLRPLRDSATLSAPGVRTGELVFETHCLHCHAIGGAGGIAGWDLSSPPILSYRKEARIRAYLDDPRRLNPQGHMPSFRNVLGAQDRSALLSYLRALK